MSAAVVLIGGSRRLHDDQTYASLMEPFCNTAKAQVSLINTAQVSLQEAIACTAPSGLLNNVLHHD